MGPEMIYAFQKRIRLSEKRNDSLLGPQGPIASMKTYMITLLHSALLHHHRARIGTVAASGAHETLDMQGRPGTARHAGPADLWHGPARKIMARKNIGTARHGKSWHGKIMARHGPEKYHKHFLEKIFFGRKIRFCPDPKSHF